MLSGWAVASVALAYLGALFALAYHPDKRADRGRSLIANPTIYALSLGVYATPGPSTAASGAPHPTASASCRSTSGRR